MLRRLRIRFSLRFGFLVLSVAVFALGLWFNSTTHRQKLSVNAILASGGTINFEAQGKQWQREQIGDRVLQFPVTRFFNNRGRLRASIVSPPTNWPETVRDFFRAGPDPSTVELEGPTIDDEYLRKYILPLKNLERLGLHGTAVTQAGLLQLRRLKKLERLTCIQDASNDTVLCPYFTMTPFYYDPAVVSLPEFGQWLTDCFGFECKIDQEALEDAGINPSEVMIQCQADKRLACVAVQEAFEAKNVGYIVQDGRMVMTTAAKAASYVQNVNDIRSSMPNLKTLCLD